MMQFSFIQKAMALHLICNINPYQNHLLPVTTKWIKTADATISRGIANAEKRDSIFYLDDSKGARLDTLWTDIFLTSCAKERTGYPTQKPVALYARMIKASSNQHGIVLDPFAGSGTTLDAAESLGRKWIGIDIGDEAIEIIQTRLRDRHGLMLGYEMC